MERQLRKCPLAAERVNVLYAAHKVLGAAKKKLRNKSRYREPWGWFGCWGGAR